MDEFMRQLHIVSIEGRPEACLGCGFEHGCSTHGCAVIKTASEQLKAYRATNHTPEEFAAVFEELAAYRAADILKIVCFMIARNNIIGSAPKEQVDVMALMTIKTMPDMLQMEECRKLLAAAEAALKEQEAANAR